MKKLCASLVVLFTLFGLAALAEEPSANPLFPKQSPKLLDWGTKSAAAGVQSIRDGHDPRDPIEQEHKAIVYPFYWGIDNYGRWVFGLVGAMNYVLESPVRLTFDGEEAFLIMPQSTLRRTAKSWIKSFGSTSYLEHYTHFERTGVYETEILVPGMPWEASKGKVIVAPHGEMYSQCLTAQNLVRTTFVVDWLEMIPNRILHASTSNGTYLGDFWGIWAFQIKETGIWIAYYELEISAQEYEQNFFSLVYFSTLYLTTDGGERKVTIYDVRWAWPPFTPCIVTTGSLNRWDASVK